MDINLIVLVSILILGSSYTAYKIGVREGIMATVNYNIILKFKVRVNC